MAPQVACLSPFDESTVRGLFPGRAIEVALVPAPPAQQAVYDACHLAHLVIADSRQSHRVDRRVLENMRNCLLIQQPGADCSAVDAEAAAEYGIPVAVLPGGVTSPVEVLAAVSANLNRVLDGAEPHSVVNGVSLGGRP